MRSPQLLILVPVAALTGGLVPGTLAQSGTPQQAVHDLLDADRSFSRSSSQKDLVDGLTGMFADDVVMPAAGGRFARGIEEVRKVLRANSDNAGARVEWMPIRGGISADGQHGFTCGYMTKTTSDGTHVPAKYLSYWIKRPAGWRVAAYKRSRAEQSPASPALMPPALPARLVPVSTDRQAIAEYRRSLDSAERAFSSEAQKIGIGPAFVKYGSSDAVNLGPPSEAEMIVGSDAIGRSIGSAYPPGVPGVTWAPDQVIVASSGDLGVTIGLITPNRTGQDGKPASVFPFFTIWRRATVADPWRYVAE